MNGIVAVVSRFGLVGATATLTYFVVTNALVYLGWLAAPIASLVGYAAGMLVSFLGQGLYTFRISGVTYVHAFRFALLSSIGLSVSYLAVLGGQKLGLPAVVGTVATCLLIPALSFVVMKAWVFVDPDS